VSGVEALRPARAGSTGAPRVLVTTPSFGQQSPRPWEALVTAGLEACVPEGTHPLSATDLTAELVRTGADAVVVGLDAVDASVFAAVPALRVVAKHGVGVDNIDLEAARAAGVVVVNAPGSNSGAVADLALGAMLALARQLLPAHASMVAGRWERFPGVELTGRTLGLVGFGRIGQAVARRASGFDMDVVAYDPFVPTEVSDAAGVRRAGLEEVVTGADFVSLHLPGTPGEPPLVDARLIEGMRRGAYFVNAARGGLVDEEALVAALRDGRLAGAALDAFAHEPPGADDPLVTAPNVLLTPHIGAFTDVANAAMGVAVAEDVARVLAGQPARNVVI